VFWFLRWKGVLLGLFFIVFLLANEAGDAILAEIKRNFQREPMLYSPTLHRLALLLASLLLPFSTHPRNF
jgi:hypothetical protein